MRGLPCVAALAAVVALGLASPGLAATCPASNPPDELVLMGGSPQTAKLHQAFGELLQVELAASNDCPVTMSVAGTTVTFTAPASGASGTFSASGANTVTVGINAQGVASASAFTADGTAGSYAVSATSPYGSISFSLTNTASGIANTITAATPTTQSATVESRYAQPLQATVLDANGNPVEGVDVTFTLGTAAGGGGAAPVASFDGGGSQATELTNGSGVATSPLFTANSSAGTFTATAATAGVVEPASFSLANLAGKRPTIIPLAPPRQRATVDSRYGKPLAAKVLGGNGKPLQGASVTFSLGAGTAGGGAGGAGGAGSAGASFVGGTGQVTEVTDAAGIAASPRFIANATPGRFSATATTTGTTDAAGFSLENLAGKSPNVAVVGRSTQSAVVDGRYGQPLQVSVRDGDGKPLQGASVSFTLGADGSGGGSGAAGAAGASFVGGTAQATETTNAAGIATSPRLTANTSAGTFTATATATGTTDAASFTLHNLAGALTTITPGVAANESTAIGTRFPILLAVTATDAHQNPVAGVAVIFAAPARGPSGGFTGKRRTVEARTDAKGVAIAPVLIANTIQGGYVVRASAAGRSAAFALVNQPTAEG